MTPLDYIAGSDWTVPLALVLLAVLAGWVRAQIRRFNRPETAGRPDTHIPPAERDLLGEDWTAPVAPYFRERFIRRTRTRMAIYSTTGADPYKGEQW